MAKKLKSIGADVEKAPTGIKGFDSITRGGLPRGRISLVFGGPGCGKTMFSSEFLVNGAQRFDEPGVFFSFDESIEKLTRNMGSIGFDAAKLQNQNKIILSHASVNSTEVDEAGEYTLDGLLVRLESAVDKVGAKRLVIDTIEWLFSGFSNERIVRREIKRLFSWIEQKGLTAVVTGERGEKTFTRYGLEEYIADCLVFLDHRVQDQISTRRLRVLKYRGSEHDADEFPFLIDRDGISVLPVTSVELEHPASREIISTGIPDLDKMFTKGGVYRGSSILVSGTAGTGKTTVASAFTNGACGRGERALYFAFEESRDQLIRNMSSIGISLDRYTRQGLLKYIAVRPTVNGLEAHLIKMQRTVEEFQPRVVVIDPMTNFLSIGTTDEVKTMLLRLIDLFKTKQITTLFTSLTEGGAPIERTDIGVSSLIDTWLLLRDIEYRGERNRGIYVLKSRGTGHSNQIREFLITDAGIKLLDVYVGREGVLIGSARARKIEEERRRDVRRPEMEQRRERLLAHKLKALESQIAILRGDYEAEQDALAEEFRSDSALEETELDTLEQQFRMHVPRIGDSGNPSPRGARRKEEQSL